MVMRILITGAKGFIGKNLAFRLREKGSVDLLEFTREDAIEDLFNKVSQSDFIVHLAGENRPKDVDDFHKVNVGITQALVDAISQSGRKIPIIMSSSTQADLDNPYGKSKSTAENLLRKFSEDTGASVLIYRLPGVFGKWSKPNYNSVVATFCHNIANELPVAINDPAASVRLVYIDDVVEEFCRAISDMKQGFFWGKIAPEYTTTLANLAEQIQSFSNCRSTLITEQVGFGFVRALYSTYLSYLPPKSFSYDLPQYGDDRGVFVEMLKTKDSGQFSYFSAHPGITRGGHYHHTKSEKFLVLKGLARFGFRNILTNETFEIVTSGERPQVVDTVPGWTHDITNIGDTEMIVMLWANEIFDRSRPDTFACKV